MKYGIQQTRDSTTTEYDGIGFRSSRNGSGLFTFRFQAPGIYYYTSGEVDPYGVIVMKGKVIVSGLQSTSAQVKVQVQNSIAFSDVSNPGPTQSVYPDCLHGIISPTPGCTAVDPLPSSLASFHFEFSECSTPEVTSISPNVGIKSTILSIKGKEFGPVACSNDVTVGLCECKVLSSSTHMITCQITTNNTLQAGRNSVIYKNK